VKFKKFKKDISAESVMKPFVLIFAFIVVLSFVIAGIGRMAISADMTEADYYGSESPFDPFNYTTIWPEGGLNVTPGASYILDEICHPEDNDPLMFKDEDEDDWKYIHIVRNNIQYVEGSTNIWEMYHDYIAIRRKVDKIGGYEWNNGIVPYSVIEDNYDNKTNVSIVDFRISGKWDSLFINTTNTSDEGFIVGLWGDNYSICYGWNTWRADDIDMWDAISIILIGEIPGVNPVLNFILHAFVYAVILFVAFTMITRIIPFIGGA